MIYIFKAKGSRDVTLIESGSLHFLIKEGRFSEDS